MLHKELFPAVLRARAWGGAPVVNKGAQLLCGVSAVTQSYQQGLIAQMGARFPCRRHDKRTGWHLLQLRFQQRKLKRDEIPVAAWVVAWRDVFGDQPKALELIEGGGYLAQACGAGHGLTIGVKLRGKSGEVDDDELLPCFRLEIEDVEGAGHVRQLWLQ